MRLKFTKMQGAGNDFVVVDGVSRAIESTGGKRWPLELAGREVRVAVHMRHAVSQLYVRGISGRIIAFIEKRVREMPTVRPYPLFFLFLRIGFRSISFALGFPERSCLTSVARALAPIAPLAPIPSNSTGDPTSSLLYPGGRTFRL
jgi:hypothetical protein